MASSWQSAVPSTQRAAERGPSPRTENSKRGDASLGDHSSTGSVVQIAEVRESSNSTAKPTSLQKAAAVMMGLTALRPVMMQLEATRHQASGGRVLSLVLILTLIMVSFGALLTLVLCSPLVLGAPPCRELVQQRSDSTARSCAARPPLTSTQGRVQPVKAENRRMVATTANDLKYMPYTTVSLPAYDLQSSPPSRVALPGEAASSRSLSTVSSQDLRPAFQQSSPRSHSHILCPNLIVPDGMEFVFAVPEALQAHPQNTTFTVIDRKGQQLMRVVVREVQGMAQCGIRVEMLDGRQLAFVNTATIHRDRLGAVQVLTPAGDIFCSLSRDEAVPNGKYTARAGVSSEKLLTFHGNFARRMVSVRDPTGHMVCTTEMCAVDGVGLPHYLVWVAPGGDAGLLLCGLLGIDKLEGIRGYGTP